MKNKNPRKISKLIYFVPLIVLYLVVFAADYLANTVFDFRVVWFLSAVISVLISMKLSKSLVKRIFFSIAGTVLSIIITLLLLFVAMDLPGSKDHNYVMYEVCLPAIMKHYNLQTNEQLGAFRPSDAQGYSKWWYQHLECESNVYKGKGPIFSENPPGFIPVSPSQ